MALTGGAVGSLLAATTAAGAQFTDVTSAAGVSYVHRAEPITEIHPPHAAGQPAAGATACDYDLDGWVDLIVTRGDAPPIVFRNGGSGSFSDATASTGDLATALPTGSNGLACGDIDNDGDPDLYVTSHGTTRFHLFINDGTGVFTEDAIARGAAVNTGNNHYGMGVGFGDYDRDGYLDALVTDYWMHAAPPAPPLPGTSHNRLLHNLGAAAPGDFEDVTSGAGLSFETLPLPTGALGAPGFSPGFVDFDDDGWQDLTWVADWGHARLFWNDQDGTFTDGTEAAGTGLERAGMGSTQDDFNGDGLLDWFVTAIMGRFEEIVFGVSNQLYINRGDRTFEITTTEAGVYDGGFGWGASGFDYDNDGDMDIAHTNGMIIPGHFLEFIWRNDTSRLFENRGDGVFDEVAVQRGITDALQGKGTLTFDYDKDGDMDLFFTNHAGPGILYRNDGGNDGSWVQFTLEGTTSNRDAFGAVLRLHPGGEMRPQMQHLLGNSNFLTHDEKMAHFGLGEHRSPAAALHVTWPSWTVQSDFGLDVETRHHLTEPAPADAPTCETADRGLLRLASRGPGTAITWTAITTRGTPFAPGSPTVAAYRVRVSDSSRTVWEASLPTQASDWTDTALGHRMTAEPDALRPRVVTRLRPNRSRVSVRGVVPKLPLLAEGLSFPVTVSIDDGAGNCLETRFESGTAVAGRTRARLN